MHEKTWMRFSTSRCDNRKSKIQNRKWAGLFAIVVSLTVCGAKAEAQQPTKVPRIGILTPNTPAANAHLLEAFKQGLREHGYVEGQNVLLEPRYGEGKVEQLPSLAVELVRLKVDVIVASTNPVIEVVKQATQTIPIVCRTALSRLGPGMLPAWPGPVETSRG